MIRLVSHSTVLAGQNRAGAGRYHVHLVKKKKKKLLVSKPGGGQEEISGDLDSAAG